VRIEVLGDQEAYQLLRPGMSVQVTIDTREAKQ
jgi:multidrug resistance efflux pump